MLAKEWEKVDLDKLEELAKVKTPVQEIVISLGNKYTARQIQYRLKRLGFFYNLRSRWTQTDKCNLIEYRKQNLSCSEIYYLFDKKFTKDAIRYRARILNIPFKVEVMRTDQEMEQLKKYCIDGLSVREIVENFNGRFTEGAIYYYMKKNGFIGSRNYSNTEIEILKKNCHGKTYLQLQEFLPHRSIKSLEKKCRELGLNQFMVNPSKTWSKQDDKVLEKYYATTTIENLCEMLPNKTKGAIKARARRLKLKKTEETYKEIKKMNSHKSSMLWTKNKTQKLLEHFKENRLEGIFNLFPEHSSKYIMKVLRDYGCVDKTPYEKAKIIVGRDPNDGLVLRDIILLYNNILLGELDEFGVFNILPEHIIYCFKYYLLKNNVQHDREFWLHVIFGELLERCKLKELVKVKFNGYYDFITSCFPKYRYKQWEFKKLDVPDRYWESKKNCFIYLKDCLDEMVKDKVIKEYQDILSVSWAFLHQYINRTIWNYHTYSSFIIEFFDEHKVDYSAYQEKIYDGILFNSKEERDVYVFLKNKGLSVRKGGRDDLVYNDVEGEGYIPDFLIDKNIIVEYFGLYNEESEYELHKRYLDKTNRKNGYYCQLEGVTYIDLYPEDLRKNFKGVLEKLSKYKLI